MAMSEKELNILNIIIEYNLRLPILSVMKLV